MKTVVRIALMVAIAVAVGTGIVIATQTFEETVEIHAPKSADIAHLRVGIDDGERRPEAPQPPVG